MKNKKRKGRVVKVFCLLIIGVLMIAVYEFSGKKISMDLNKNIEAMAWGEGESSSSCYSAYGQCAIIDNGEFVVYEGMRAI